MIARALGALCLDFGTLAAGVASLLVALPLSFIRAPPIRWALVLILPFVVAYAVYWMPVWSGISSGEQYGSWEILVVPGLGGAGLLAAAATCSVVGLTRRALEGRRRAGA